MVLACRGVYFCGGFHWIRTRGHRCTADIAPIIALAPHSSYFDSLPTVFLDLTTVVAKSSSEHVPMFGSRSNAKATGRGAKHCTVFGH